MFVLGCKVYWKCDMAAKLMVFDGVINANGKSLQPCLVSCGFGGYAVDVTTVLQAYFLVKPSNATTCAIHVSA